MILSIARREFTSLFLSPMAWVLLAVVQFILAWTFFTAIEAFFAVQKELTTLPNPPGVTDLVVSPLFEAASVILLMIIPLLSMRLISEERRSKTLSLLLSAPVSITEIVLGKYLGLLAFILVLLAMISLMPLSLAMGTSLDYAKLFSGLLGLSLMLAAFAAAGLYMSALSDSPLVAAISSFGLLLLLWLLGNSATSAADGVNTLNYLSLHTHFSVLLRGILDSADIAYFLLFISGFLVLAIRQLETRRLQA